MLDTISTPARNGATALDDNTVQAFKAQLRGDLLHPSDAGYDAARILFNASIDKHPTLIARCVDVADVMAAVNFGRDQGLDIAVRSGGHSLGGMRKSPPALSPMHDCQTKPSPHWGEGRVRGAYFVTSCTTAS